MKQLSFVSLSVMASIAIALNVSVPSTAEAAAHAAKVVYAFGDVSAKNAGGTSRAIRKGDLIAPGDTVVTGKGRAQLSLTDGGFVALNPSTEYAIEDYNYDSGTPSNSKSFFNLVKGGVRLITGAIGRTNRQNWRLRTSVATIGIRGSQGYFRFLGTDLLITVAEGGFTSEDPTTGLQSDLGPGNYLCSSPCRPLDGPGSEREDLGYFEPDDPPYEGGEDQVANDGPIPPGPAPEGTHISVSYSFTEPNMTFPPPTLFLNGRADGEVVDNMDNFGVFGTLESFQWRTGFPCEPCIFTRNGGTEIADPAPDMSTFNNELSAEWGRVINAWAVDDQGNHTPVGHFHYVASIDETPVSEFPTSGVLTYNQDVGGTLATHTFGENGDTEVATARSMVTMVVDYGPVQVRDLRVEGSFPSGTTFVLQSPNPGMGMTPLSNGQLSFNSLLSNITVPNGSQPSIVTGSTMCNGGCTFFGTSVFGPAGPNAIGMTGAFHGNTSQPSYPAHSINGTFVLKHQ